MSPPKPPFWAGILIQAVFWVLVLFLASGLAIVIASADQ